MKRVARLLCVALIGCKPSLQATDSAAVSAPADAAVASASASAAPTEHVVGVPFFVDDAGTQAELCEPGSPPLPIVRGEKSSCWYAGASCEGHGAQAGEPFALNGNVISGERIAGGCNPGTYALVYEKQTSPLRVRVCGRHGPPHDCPAMMRDGARWDITLLLEANHATKAVLLGP